MAVVGHNITIGVPITLDAADEFTPVCEIGTQAGLVDITLQFDSSWSGTVRFDRAVKVSGAWIYDPFLATNLVSAATGTTTTGGTSATENWRVDASGAGVRVYAQAVAGGSVAVTFTTAEG